MVLLHSKSKKFTHDIPQGKLEDAERYLRRAVVEARAGFCTGDPHVAAALNNLAELYRCDTRLQCVRAWAQQVTPCFSGFAVSSTKPFRCTVRRPPCWCALRLLFMLLCHETDVQLVSQEAAYGSSHPSVAAALHNLAGVYTQQRNYAAAAATYRDALRRKEASLGRLHPEYASTLAHLAEVTALHGRPKDAAALMRESLDVLDAIGAGGMRVAQRRMARLGHMLTQSGQHSDAVAVLRKLVQAADWAASQKPDDAASLWTAHARVALADALCANRDGSSVEAQQLYTQCLADMRRIRGDTHPLTAACMRRCADMQLREGTDAALQQAHDLAIQALKVLTDAHAQSHADAGLVEGAGADRERVVVALELAAAQVCTGEVLQRLGNSEAATHLAAAAANLKTCPPGHTADALRTRLKRMRHGK